MVRGQGLPSTCPTASPGQAEAPCAAFAPLNNTPAMLLFEPLVLPWPRSCSSSVLALY